MTTPIVNKNNTSTVNIYVQLSYRLNCF